MLTHILWFLAGVGVAAFVLLLMTRIAWPKRRQRFAPMESEKSDVLIVHAEARKEYERLDKECDKAWSAMEKQRNLIEKEWSKALAARDSAYSKVYALNKEIIRLGQAERDLKREVKPCRT